jgi:transposase
MGFGRSRGGLTTKLHAAVDQLGRLLRLILTPDQRADVSHFEADARRSTHQTNKGVSAQ